QVERHADVVVDEHRAVLPLERFLERLDRVAVDLAEPDLIHLLEVEERIAYSDVAQRGNDLARLRADARPSRTDDLRLAASAQLETRERPTESFRKRTHERALAHVRRPDDARDRSDEVAAQARDGELIEQSLLRLLEPEERVVECLLYACEVDLFGRRRCGRAPRKMHQPIDVRPDLARIGAGRRRAQPLDLRARLGGHTRGQIGRLDATQEVDHFTLDRINLAQLRLQHLDTTPQRL